jgi:deoxyadenosine/deoxycytidine kinase
MSDTNANTDDMLAMLTTMLANSRDNRIGRVKPVIVTIDGGIGSGKSTSVDQLKTAFAGMSNVFFIQEPVDMWNRVVSENGETILANFYRDPKEHAFKFQMMAYISRLSILLNAVRNPEIDIIVTERCVETDRNVFEKMLYHQGQIDLIGHTIYNMWFDEFNRDVCATGIIYIRASAETCIARITHRAREGEVISAEYISECNAYHENWIMNDPRSKLIIDADADTVHDTAAADDKILKMITFILSLLVNEYK